MELKNTRRVKRTIKGKTIKLTPPSDERSNIMSKIPSSNSSIEILIRDELTRQMINFSKPEFIIEKIEGNPDFVIPKYRIAIFCDGDFWHGYTNSHKKINSNNEFWNTKIERNIERDEEVNQHLSNNGWKVFRFWEHEIKKDAKICVEKIKNFIQSEKLKNQTPAFTFVDLFSGIGGFRIALENAGGKCLGFSEIDKKAIEVYKKNFIDFTNYDEKDLGDITKLGKLPFKVDLIVGGVPCQSWSVAGKNRGFNDPRGKLWEDAIRVVKLNKPKAVIFENVKGLYDPRNKKNLQLIVNSIKKLGYDVKYQLLNSFDFGLPQNRDRIFIVCIRKNINNLMEFNFPKPINQNPKLYNFIDDMQLPSKFEKNKFNTEELFGGKIPASRNRFQKEDELNDFFIFSDTRKGHSTIHSWDLIRTSKREKDICLIILRNRRKKRYGTSDGNPLHLKDLTELIPNLKIKELETLVRKRILRKINGNKYELVNSKNSSGINNIYRVYLPQSDVFSTLTATGTRDYLSLKYVKESEPDEYKSNFIKEVLNGKHIRQISGREAGRLQGFSNNFIIAENEKNALKQFGNAVSVNVIFHLVNALKNTNIFK